MLVQERLVQLCLDKSKNYLEFERLAILKEQLKIIKFDDSNKKVGRGVPPALLAEFALNSPTQRRRHNHYTLFSDFQSVS